MLAAGISQASRAQLVQVLHGQRFVTPRVAAATLDLDDKAAARKLAQWAEAGWLRRVRRGLYIPVPINVEHPQTWVEDALVVAATVWDPCYFTGWTAANHWSLTEQTFRTVVLKTAVRVRQASVELLDRRYLITHASPVDMEWGLKTVWQEDMRLRFADSARTVVDALDSPHLGGGIRHTADILVNYLASNDPMLLIEYADRLNNGAVFKRLGYIVEHIGSADSRLVDACQARLTSGISMLDPDGSAKAPRNARWRMRINAQVGREDRS